VHTTRGGATKCLLILFLVLPETINSLDLAVKIFNFEKLHGVCTDYPLKVLNLMKLI